MFCRTSRSEAGFTMIEVLVAIAVLAVVLGAVGTVVGNTVRNIHQIDRRLPLLETARNLLASLPARNAMQPGTQTGSSGQFRWRIDATPLATTAPNPDDPDAAKIKWIPLAITVRVQSSEGPPLRLDTVRLVPKPAG
jgi:general secretion pathway protein I